MGPQMVISTYMMRLLRLNALHLTCVCLCSGGIDVCNLLNDGSLSIFLCPLQSITAYRLRWSACSIERLLNEGLQSDVVCSRLKGF